MFKCFQNTVIDKVFLLYYYSLVNGNIILDLYFFKFLCVIVLSRLKIPLSKDETRRAIAHSF